MRLLLFNLGMDDDDPVLGFTNAWTTALALRCEHVTVITMSVGKRVAVPGNVTIHSLGKELGYGKPRRLLEFYKAVLRLLRHDRPDACFAHMAARSAILFAPLAKAYRIPVLFWYHHEGTSWPMRLAHRVTDRSISATASGFRLRSDKLWLTGHGVDTAVFRPPDVIPSGYHRTLLSVGRMSAIKRNVEMVEALGRLVNEDGRDVRLRFVGPSLTGADGPYSERVRARVSELGLGERVDFVGPVPFSAVPRVYHEGGVYLTFTEHNLDKAIVEAMASGCVPVGRNASWAAIARAHALDRLVPGAGSRAVADAIGGVLDLPADERAQLGHELRGIVESEHSLDALADQIVRHLDAIRTGGRAARIAPASERDRASSEAAARKIS